jgi:ATP-dependent DNA helicase RecQ
VTFPPIRLVERLWTHPGDGTRTPRNVLASVERLRHELKPERGPVDWEPVRQRRRQAESRVDAMEAYARGSGCRRRALIGYFGEALRHCSGCDRCKMAVSVRALSAEAARRLSRLRRAMAGRSGPWGGSLLEGEVLLNLARDPPSSATALADVPGVGPALAERYGATILEALGVGQPVRSELEDDPRSAALLAWRNRVARDMGVPVYAVLPDAALRTLLSADFKRSDSLGALPGLGPRAREKFGAELIRLLQLSSAPLPPAP